METVEKHGKEKALELLEQFYENKADVRLYTQNMAANYVLGVATFGTGLLTLDKRVCDVGAVFWLKGLADSVMGIRAGNKANRAERALSIWTVDENTTIPDTLLLAQKAVSKQHAKDRFRGVGQRLVNAVFKNKDKIAANRQALEQAREQFRNAPSATDFAKNFTPI